MLQRTPENAIFSLRQVFVSAFLAGEKCVELRRKAPSLAVGSHIWFYSKLPVGKIVASARLQSVAILPVEQIWSEHQRCISLGREDFDHYLTGLSEATVMSFDKFSALLEPIDLETLRCVEPGFHPPQFFRRVHEGSLLDKLSRSIVQQSGFAVTGAITPKLTPSPSQSKPTPPLDRHSPSPAMSARARRASA